MHSNKLIVAILSLLILLGCRAKEIELNNSPKPVDEFVKKSDQLYEAYLNGNRIQAKRSLDALLIATEAANLSPDGHAHTLFKIYARLYVFEKRNGNQSAAEADFVQVKHWLLQTLKSRGQLNSQATEEVDEYTTDKCLKEVDEWDKAHHNGMLPNYVAK
jgi:hypothetical protein